MPSLDTARQSHHRNESAGEAAFHRVSLRETEILKRVPSCKERQRTKPATRVPNGECKTHNVDSKPHKNIDGNVGKPSSCFSCFLLPRKKSKDVRKACRDGVTAKPNRDFLVENAIKAGISKTHSVSSPRHTIVTPKGLNNAERAQLTAIEIRSKKKSDPSMVKPLQHTVTSHPRNKASERSLSAVHMASKAASKPSSITCQKPVVATPSGKTSNKSMSLIRPHLVAKAANRSSPPMNISSPQSAEVLGQITRRSSPISISSECLLETFPKQGVRTYTGPKPARLVEKAKIANTNPIREKVSDSRESAQIEKKVVWREGLLQRLGKLHGLGNCKLSLEELIELDDNACLDELECLHRHECAPLHLPPERPSLSATRPSLASTWNMEFEGGRPILPLKRQDVSPEVMHGIVWPLSHTNCLFEASKRHPRNYKDEECRVCSSYLF
ncbi:hypothetical protein GOP47_0021058 [Adiantum capillus-veneris]|uniref:Uncharacterized protein n=1 Tax=Adiantum capillus-veneris TaxID=13818 RepID=A0A9D4Z6Q1_ADICA|nr:hypothetical protein GOP47_0021058 [Adiantum capillus-veneris]